MFNFLPLLLLAFLPVLAHAQSVEVKLLTLKATQENLFLLGSGIQNENTDDAIALACTGPIETRCGELTHVFLDFKAQISYWIGSPIAIPLIQTKVGEEIKMIPDEKEIKKAIRKLSQDYRVALRKKRGGLIDVLWKTGTLGGVLCGIVISSPPLIIISAVALAVADFLFDLSTPIGAGHSTVAREFQRKDGWNWAAHARKINPNRFQVYFSMVLNSKAAAL
jgi:hypothetical protein